jgi:aminoglycoside phosphotransferase (APT) family kinase protein
MVFAGRYEIIEEIGRGGMGVVYRAHEDALARDVAIKVLPPEFASDPERLRRFEQEAKAVGQLSHPNILVVHDVGSQAGAPYLVTELLEGESLRQSLERGELPLQWHFQEDWHGLRTEIHEIVCRTRGSGQRFVSLGSHFCAAAVILQCTAPEGERGSGLVNRLPCRVAEQP